MTKKSFLGPYRDVLGANLVPSFHLEADGRGRSASVMISGVVGVRELSDREISIITRSESFVVRGEVLSVSVLESNRIRLVGLLESISFSKRKRNGAL